MSAASGHGRSGLYAAWQCFLKEHWLHMAARIFSASSQESFISEPPYFFSAPRIPPKPGEMKGSKPELGILDAFEIASHEILHFDVGPGSSSPSSTEPLMRQFVAFSKCFLNLSGTVFSQEEDGHAEILVSL